VKGGIEVRAGIGDGVEDGIDVDGGASVLLEGGLEFVLVLEFVQFGV
jgi:hypothetical protein